MQKEETKIGVKSVTIRRAEGPIDLCKTVTFATFAEANAYLAQGATTVYHDPKLPGCYDKHDFWVEFCDGSEYKGRIDLHHPDYAPPDKVGKHIKEFCKFYGGMATEEDLPKRFLPIEKYRAFLVGQGVNPAPYIEFFTKYDLND